MEEQVVKPKRKGVNGKKKGANFEGRIAKELGAMLPPMKFKRTDGSGARLGGKNWEKMFANFSKDMMAQYVGDICTTNEADCPFTFNFVVECKCYKQREHVDLLFDKSSIYIWLKEAEVDAEKLGKPGLLICTWNNTPVYVAARFNLPTEKKLILLDGVEVCRFEDIKDVRDFWVTTK